MVTVAGETAMEASVFAGAAIVRVAVPLSAPMVAVTVVEPAATPVAIPDEVMVATFPFASAQVAEEVTSAIEPSLYVACAVNCSVAPTARLAVAGEAAIELRTLVVPPELMDELPPQPAAASSSERQRQRNEECAYL
jgi:hypothetical protein